MFQVEIYQKSRWNFSADKPCANRSVFSSGDPRQKNGFQKPASRAILKFFDKLIFISVKIKKVVFITIWEL